MRTNDVDGMTSFVRDVLGLEAVGDMRTANAGSCNPGLAEISW